MLEKIKRISENKALKIIGNIIYGILVIFVLLLLIVVAMQRFSNNTIAVGGFRIFNIVTESMVPEYKVGDVILDKQVDPDSLKVGDDITYLGKTGDFSGRVVTHRIEEIEKQEDGNYRIVTKGIANTLQDPEITNNEVQGKVIHKFIVLSFLSKIINNDLGSMYIWIFIPMALIIFVNIKRIFLGSRDDDEDDDEDEDAEDNEEDEEEQKK